MNVAVQRFSENETPAYVEFEMRAKQDADASIKAGHPVYVDVDFAIIRPSGTDTLTVIEKEVEDWLSGLSNRKDQFYPQYKAHYDGWRSVQDEPTEGLSIRLWPALTPAQIEQCLQCGIRTVEDLAAAKAKLVNDLGRGGQSMVNRAKSWLETAIDAGAIAEQNAALLTQVDNLKATLGEKDDEIKALSARLEEFELTNDPSKPTLGRKAKASTKSGK